MAALRWWRWWLAVTAAGVLLGGAAPAPEPERVKAGGGGWGATLWGWLRPWTWWSAPEEAPPPPRNLTASVTVRCGEQTCTTELCAGAGGACETRTCGIYDTDVRGFCRDYNTTASTSAPSAVTGEPIRDRGGGGGAAGPVAAPPAAAED